ncbi:hypothetical protein J6I39_04195 [bacterium]|nr:hypothetical protein [bacterium]
MGIGSLAWKALKLAPEFILGTSSEVIGKAAKATKGSIFAKAKAGAKAFEKDIAAKHAAQGGFFKRLWHNSTHFVQDIIKDTKSAKYSALRKAVKNKDAIARLAAKNKTTEKAVAKAFVNKSTLKGFGKAVMKKMPFIGQILTLGFEIPNIYRATRDEGIATGLKETAWAAGELGGFAAGSAIGSVICPGIGTIIGGLIGCFGVSMLRGGNYTDKKEELMEKYQVTEEQISNAQKQGYTVDNLLEEMNSQAAESSTKGQDASQGTQDENTSTNTSSSGSSNSSAGASSTGSAATGSDTATTTAQQPTTTVTTPFPTPWSMSGFAMGTGMGMGMFNPFGMGMGMYNPASAVASTLLQPGENIFEKYPMGYKFQYMG